MKALAILVIAATTAHADRPTADRLSLEADAAADAKDFATAALKFRAAYAADPRPELVCNTGVAYYKLADLTRAERYLKQCLEQAGGLDAEFLARVQAVLSKVEATLVGADVTPVDLIVEPATATSTIDAWPDEPIVGSHRIWLAYGTHRIAIRATGFVEQALDIAATSHEPSVRHVKLAPVAAPPQAIVVRPVAIEAAPSNGLANGLLIGAGAVALVGVGLHIGALHVRGELADATDVPTWQSHRGTFEGLRLATLVSYGVALVAGGAGAYLRYRHAHERDVVVTVTTGVPGIALEWHR